MPTVLVQNEALEVELDAGENLKQGLSKYGVTVYDFMWVHPFVRPLTALLLVGTIALVGAVFGYMIANMGGLYTGVVIGILSAGYPVMQLMTSDHTQVIVMDGRDSLNEPTDREIAALGEDRIAAGIRLASEVKVNGDCEIHCHP